VIGRAFNPTLAAQSFANPPHNGQAQTMTLDAQLVSLCELGEEAGLFFWRQSRPIVAHPETHHLPIFQHSRSEFKARRPATRFDRMTELIDPHFFDPGGVANGRRPGKGHTDFSPLLLS
jgi:hypothetical protein